MCEMVYTIPQLSALSGIKRSTLYYWARIGRLEPAYPPPEPLLFSLAALKTAISRAQAKQPLAWYLKSRQMSIRDMDGAKRLGEE
ncbi:hypothetical protein KSF_106430 [Reticulibacter mediterranei]|uniref:Uncharacterized protein n=1 Tax=Reticulibacter mediterranei TaxID=2778369 RepID=A0A8J3IY38_9CHLR|nr:hypothetical protein [Reticulibacter mediterranei]GHP00596.1 hypothetical protein KSF_106430 [Reticulibacter mediterranei]